jgi:hyaluronan synthase
MDTRQQCRKTDNIKYILFLGAICLAYLLFILALPYLQVADIIPPLFRKVTNGIMFSLTFFFLIRYIIALFHKHEIGDRYFRPVVSILIPVKNEEGYIAKTIAACYASNYPDDRIDVIVINDGSTDNTADSIDSMREKWPAMKVLHLEKNIGKRDALVTGLEQASGEIAIMIDSDTFIEANAVRRIVRHFKDERVGAVSGHTNVYNHGHNALTKLQGYKYHIAHRLFKSFESSFNTVTCCPGCFSAFRISYLKPLVDRWTNWRFFGMDCTSGEDRALTALMLRQYRVTYEPSSVACTIVPHKLGVYLRQQMRWIRSYFRESMFLGKFMWKKHPLAAISFYLSIVLSFAAPATLVRELLIYPILMNYLPFTFVTAVLIGVALMALFSILTGKWRYLLHVLGYTGLYMGIIVWMIPVALLTLRNNGWGSRGVDSTPVTVTE